MHTRLDVLPSLTSEGLTDVVRGRVPAKQAKMKRWFDMKRRARSTVLKQGDKVHVSVPSVARTKRTPKISIAKRDQEAGGKE